MAFENVFGNVRFDIPAQQAESNRNFLAQMIGAGIQDARYAKEMDMKERQMAQKANQIDIKRLSENYAMKRELGMMDAITPEEEAAANVRAKTERAQIYTDAYGRQVVQPSGYANYMGVSQGAMQQPTALAQGIGGATMAQRGEFPAYQDIPATPMQPQMLTIDDLGQFQDQTPVGGYAPQDVVSGEEVVKEGVPELKVPEMTRGLKGSPVGNLKQWEAMKDFTEKQWKAEMDFSKEKLKTERGKNQVGNLLNRMDEINDALKQREAIMVGDAPLKDRIKTYLETTGVGQEGRKILDPETQAYAEEYRNLQATLLPFYATAAGLGAKSLDSEGERKSILDSFGSPSGIYSANARQIDNLRKTFGLEPKSKVEELGNKYEGWSIKRK